MRNVILFGPPGVGKSTIIAELARRGYRAFDLEEVNDRTTRHVLPNHLRNFVLGAADYSPDPKVTGKDSSLHLLLYVPQQKYESRREARDNRNVAKKNQAKHAIDDWTSNFTPSEVIDASGSVEQTVNALIKRIPNSFKH